MRFSLFRKQLTQQEEKDLGTNGRLKRYIALSILRNNYFVAMFAFTIVIALYTFNGYSWITISAEQFTVITVIAKSLIDGMLNQIGQLVNYYFERDNKELENGNQVLQTQNQCGNCHVVEDGTTK